ncbi:MAG: hypothetical protein MRZ20_05370 [Dialister succinatiphilus]|nr:hypothetical protein [Dialister succinatiphilus]
MSNGKNKINIRMKAFFSAWGEGEKEVLYIFFHNFTACQWKLSVDRYPLENSGQRERHQTARHQTSEILSPKVRGRLKRLYILRPQGATTTLSGRAAVAP